MRQTLALSVIIIGTAAAAFFGWREYEARQEAVCDVCYRPIHRESEVWAEAGGERQHLCCLGCALSERRQTHQEVEVSSLADYETGAPLDPAAAVLVVGSDVNLCLRPHSRLDEHSTVLDHSKRPAALDFDRCSPSILAFRDRAAAARFAAREGGDVMTFEQMRGAFE